MVHIRTEYGEMRTISPNSGRMRKNADQNNSEYGHFSRSVYLDLLSIQVGVRVCIPPQQCFL